MADLGRPGRSLTRVTHAPIATAHDVPTRSFAAGMETELRTYWGIFRRRMRWILGFLFGAVALAFLYTITQPPVYRATALIEVRGGGESPSLEGLFAAEEPSAETLRTHFGLLSSATLAGRVIDELGLAELEEFNPELEAPRSAIVAGFLERLVVDPVEESRLVMINFDASTPELAARIVNEVIDTYAELRVDGHEEAAQRIARQVDSVEVRLGMTEDSLRVFAAEHDLPVLVEEDLAVTITEQLGDLRTRQADAQGLRFESESWYDVVVGEGRRDLLEDEGLQILEQRRSELRAEHARLSATFLPDYPAVAELGRQIEQVEALIREERGRLAGRIESDYMLARQREANIEEAIAEQRELANELGPATGDYHVLRQAVLANRQLYATLLDQRRQAEIVAAIGATDLAVVDPAMPPLEPYRPVFALNMGLAIMLGLVLGVGAAFVREMFDSTVQTAEDFPVSEEVPVLAMIPAMGPDSGDGSTLGSLRKHGMLPWPDKDERGRRRASWPRIDRVDRTSSALADSFGALRTAVLFNDEEPLPRSILVSSCRAGEGKTTVSVNLAMSLAQLGNRVLLLDADLRRPSVHRAFKIPVAPGLMHCLTNGVGWEEVVRPSVASRLDVLTAGGATNRAGDLLAGPRLGPLLRRLEERYDYVVVDAPALFINAPDARVLSQLVDGVVVVVRSRLTPRALVDRIPRAVPNVLGVVVNDLKKNSLPAYYADYFAEYGEGPENGSRSRNGRTHSDGEKDHPVVSSYDPKDPS